MNKLYCLIIFCLSFISQTTKAQEFINGELFGIISGFSSLPIDWLNVPYNDINCLATAPVNATPDLTNFTQPDLYNGIIGNSYSGNTFVSGLFADAIGPFFHEGIMQTVSGFTPGNTYPIHFHQAVVKQINCLDSSGSWAVYIDNTLAGITAPTMSTDSFNSTSFIWESRTVFFVATAISHTIKFLPMDDDSSWGNTNNAGLRMGIDCIYINKGCDSFNTDINSFNLDNNLVVFPNPMNDELKFETGSNEVQVVVLYDIASRKLLKKEFTNSVSVNVEQFPKGIYFYEVSDKYGIIKKGKILKE